MRNEKILYTLLACHEVVSFDIFDTLVKRNVSKPKDIFPIVQKRYYEETGNNIKDFTTLRKEAEKKARDKSKNEEITLEEIYDILCTEHGLNRCMMDIEMLVEQEYCTANIPMKKVYDDCVEKGKRIIIVSDMYLPETVLKMILSKCGYDNYEKLYVSSEYLLTKRSGNLFDYVISDLQLEASKILHIGDNVKSDFVMPLSKGMHSWPVRRDRINTQFFGKKDLFENKSFLIPCLNNNICKYEKENDAFRYGYELLGPLLIAFCLWIEKESLNNGYDKLYFLARDMYLFFDTYKRLTGKSNIQYLEVSRKSLRNAYVLKKGSVESILDTMSRNDYTIEDLLCALHITEEDKMKIAAECGEKNISKHIEELQRDERSKVNECIMMILKKRSDLAVDFLRERGLFTGNNCLVDIGWHGTIQNMIETLCGKSYNGLYFGNTRRPNYAKMSMKGYWFDAENETEVKEELALTYILEVMLFPPVGTTVAYKKSALGIMPVFENNNEQSTSLIKDFQEGALKFVEDYTRQISDRESVPAELAVSAYCKFAFYPTRKNAEIFGREFFEDGNLYKLCKTHSFKEYMGNPGLLPRDYKDSKWKEGYIKLVFPFIRNPHRIACIIKKRRK